MVRSSRRVKAMGRALAASVLALSVVVGGAWSVASSAAPAEYASQAGRSWVPNGVVKAMVRSGGVVYLGGSFTSLVDPVSGTRTTRNRVAALDAATGDLLAWNPNANGLVDAIAVAPDGTVYLGGDFTTVGGTTATKFAAVTASLGTRVRWTASANNTVHDLYADAESVYVAGRFGAVNGKNRPKLAQVTRAATPTVTAFNAAVTGGRVLTIEPAADGSLLIGGDFTSVGGQPRSFIAGVTRGSGTLTGWSPAPLCTTCNVWDVAATTDAVYAAVGGPGGRVAAWDAPRPTDTIPATPSVTPVTPALRWSRSGDGNVQAIDVHGGFVYAGGHFGPVFDATTRHQLATLRATDGELQDYTVAVTGNDHPGIWALDADDDGLRIAGGFVLAGNPAARYAAFPLAPPVGG